MPLHSAILYFVSMKTYYPSVSTRNTRVAGIETDWSCGCGNVSPLSPKCSSSMFPFLHLPLCTAAQLQPWWQTGRWFILFWWSDHSETWRNSQPRRSFLSGNVWERTISIFRFLQHFLFVAIVYSAAVDSVALLLFTPWRFLQSIDIFSENG